MILIGLAGHAGVGKDTAAEALSQSEGLTILGFATALKRACSIAFNIPIGLFEDPVEKNLVISEWGMSPRQMAQFVGTELFRNKIRDDFWVRRLEIEAEYYTASGVVVKDVRFQNEADWIWSKGGTIIHIFRPGHVGAVGIPDHQSEAGFTVPTHWEEGGKYIRAYNTSTIADFTSQIYHIYRNRINK